MIKKIPWSNERLHTTSVIELCSWLESRSSFVVSVYESTNLSRLESTKEETWVTSSSDTQSRPVCENDSPLIGAQTK